MNEQAEKIFPLTDLAAHETAIIHEIRGNNNVMRRRLMDLGFIPGTEIAFIRQAPHGGMCLYTVRDTMYALREEDAGNIFIRREV